MTNLNPYEQNIQDFKYLLQTQPELFTDSDRAEVTNLIRTLPENIEQISDAIATWCEAHSNVLDALLALPIGDSNVRGPGNRPTQLDPKEAKEDLLDNLTRKSQHSASSPKPSTNPSPPTHE